MYKFNNLQKSIIFKKIKFIQKIIEIKIPKRKQKRDY